MKYIFEDDYRSPLCKLFNSMYSKEVRRNFIYARGSGNIINAVGKVSDDCEQIFVYVDVVPDNLNTVVTYNKIRRLCRKRGNMIVFPIMCREYYYIKALIGSQAVKRENIARCCIQREDYRKSGLIETEEDSRFCKNFEKACKLTIKKALKQCAALDGNRIPKYFLCSCLCGEDDSCSNSVNLVTKCISILKAFECIPSNSIAKGTYTIDWEECIEVHRELVDSFNNLVDVLSAGGNEGKLKKISYIY